MCLVYCFSWSCTVNQLSFGFMTFICLGIHQESVLILRRLQFQTARTTEPYQCCQRPAIDDLGVTSHLHNCYCFVASLGGLKERAGMSKCVFWPIEWPPLRFVGSDFQYHTDRSGLQHSCTELLLGKCLLETLPFPRGDSVYILEGSACWWCMDKPNQTWSIGIGIQAPYYTLVLAKKCKGFVPSVLSKIFCETSISLKIT